MFCERLKKEGITEEEASLVRERLMEENRLKELNIMAHPLIASLFAVSIAVMGAMFDKLSWQPLAMTLALLCFILWFAFHYIIAFRTKTAKMNDLILFLMWYRDYSANPFHASPLSVAAARETVEQNQYAHKPV
ncbi:MAG: hypothetical protein ACO2ZM_08080 [Francisellaceae bacterium]